MFKLVARALVPGHRHKMVLRSDTRYPRKKSHFSAWVQGTLYSPRPNSGVGPWKDGMFTLVPSGNRARAPSVNMAQGLRGLRLPRSWQPGFLGKHVSRTVEYASMTVLNNTKARFIQANPAILRTVISYLYSTDMIQSLRFDGSLGSRPLSSETHSHGGAWRDRSRTQASSKCVRGRFGKYTGTTKNGRKVLTWAGVSKASNKPWGVSLPG